MRELCKDNQAVKAEVVGFFCETLLGLKSFYCNNSNWFSRSI